MRLSLPCAPKSYPILVILWSVVRRLAYLITTFCRCTLAPEIVKPQNNSRYDNQKKHIKKHIPSSNLEANQYSSDPFAEPVRPYKPNIQSLQVLARDPWHTIVMHLGHSTEYRQSERCSWQVVSHVESCIHHVACKVSAKCQARARGCAMCQVG